MVNELKELWRFRELLLAMVERELRIRYKNSFLGFFWSLLNPLVTVFVMWLVFSFLLKNNTPNFSAYMLASYLPYLFFSTALMDSAQSVLVALPVVRKVYFPREILPLASIISNFIHFLLALLVFFVFLFMVWAGSGFEVTPFSWRALFLPVLLVVTLALTTGASLLISALNVFYEDIKYMVSVVLYLLYFLTPIFYFSETVWYALKGEPNRNLIYTLYHLNPLAELATIYRKVLLAPGQIEISENRTAKLVSTLPTDWAMFGVTVVTSFAILVFGYWVFNRMKWRFVEKP